MLNKNEWKMFTTYGLLKGIAQRIARMQYSNEDPEPQSERRNLRRTGSRDTELLDLLIVDSRKVLAGKWRGQKEADERLKKEKEMSMQLQVMCDSCGMKFVSQGVPQAIDLIDLKTRNTRQKDLCALCLGIVKKLLYRAATPEDEFGATSTEAIRTAISAMAERRKQVFEEGEKQ